MSESEDFEPFDLPVDHALLKMYRSGNMYGYPIREPFSGEHEFFKKNTHVTGMATDDNKITLNPYSNIPESNKALVAKNEALRLFMREHGIDPKFEITKKQDEYFKKYGGSYGEPGNERHLRSTLVSRILTGDPTALDFTDEQRSVSESIMNQLRSQSKLSAQFKGINNGG